MARIVCRLELPQFIYKSVLEYFDLYPSYNYEQTQSHCVVIVHIHALIQMLKVLAGKEVCEPLGLRF